MPTEETQEMWVWSLDWEDPVEEEMATHSSIPNWRIPWTEEPGGQQPIRPQRVGHNWAIEHAYTRTWEGPNLGRFKTLLTQFFYLWNEVKVAHLCPTLCDPMDYPVHGILDYPIHSQNTGVGSLSLLQGICRTQRLNTGLPHCRRTLYQLSRKGSLFYL